VALDPTLWVVQAAALGGALVAFVLALRLRDLIRSIACFALGSALVAASFFVLASPLAAVFQLTVGAGLIAVLFLVAVTLAGGEEEAGA